MAVFTVSISDGTTLSNLAVSAGRGPKGDGFTGGTYDAGTGKVTFSSNDGIGFETGDLRGDLTEPGPIGSVTPSTGAFTSLSTTGDAVVGGTDTLYVDSSNNRVGIGTSSPTGRTEIADAGAVNDRLLHLNSSGGLADGQTGPLYGLYSDIKGNNNATETYGGYFKSVAASNRSYGVFSETEQRNSTKDSIAIYGNATVNSASTNHRSNRSLGSGPVAGVYATATTTGTNMVAQTTALHALNSTVYGAEAYGAWIETTAGPTTVVPMKVAHDGSELMRIDSSGSLLVGKSAIDAGSEGFEVRSGAGTFTTRDGGQAAVFNRLTSDGVLVIFQQDGATAGSISVTSSSTSYNTSSDERLKENIADAQPVSDLIDGIQVREFDWKADGEHQRYGMVAQELETVAPEAVTKGDTDEEMWSVDYSKLVPMLVKEIQDLRKRVADLET